MMKTVLVVGVGYVGFPVVIEALRAGHSVIGFDIDSKRISQIKSLKVDLDLELKVFLNKCLENGQAKFVTCIEDDIDIDVALICVPTPLDKSGNPDLTALKKAVNTLATTISNKTLVILESSSFPGTTRKEVAQRLMSIMSLDQVLVAYSPERIDPGNLHWNLRNTPKIVAGIDEKSLGLALDFYNSIVDNLVQVDSLELAELAKLFENTYRLVNIALVNEFVSEISRTDLDPYAVLSAAYTKPFGISRFEPSGGIGGHCIPVDPEYLTHWASLQNLRLSIVESALLSNKNLAKKIVEIVTLKAKEKERKILLCGVAYKPNISDTRESSASRIWSELTKAGFEVAYHDPLVPNWQNMQSTEIFHWEGDFILLNTIHNIMDLNLLTRKQIPTFDLRVWKWT